MNIVLEPLPSKSEAHRSFSWVCTEIECMCVYVYRHFVFYTRLGSYSSFDLESPSGSFEWCGWTCCYTYIADNSSWHWHCFSYENSGTCKLCIIILKGLLQTHGWGGCLNCGKIGIILTFGAERG